MDIELENPELGEAIISREPNKKEVKTEYATVPEVAAHYGVDQTTVRRWLRKGRMKGKRVGSRWYVEMEVEKEAPPKSENGKGLKGIKCQVTFTLTLQQLAKLAQWLGDVE